MNLFFVKISEKNEFTITDFPLDKGCDTESCFTVCEE